ncbi:MAG: HAD family hydrolase, partial [Candidatus Azambacteria bacterium]|nr:HAD family hydrolase [Candidatus Azambacteria bacterium]
YSCQNMSYAFDGLLKIIQDLRKSGIKCVIATDNMDTFRRWTIPGMNLKKYFDDFLISNELKNMKFDIDRKNNIIPFFDSYLKENNLNYGDVALIDDCIDDGFYGENGFDILQTNSPESLKMILLNVAF